MDRTTYFPDFAQPADVPIYKHTLAYRKFYERYGGHRVFDVHRDSSRDEYRGRHNAFHIDADKMFSTETFTRELAARLKDCGKPKYIVSLATAANRRLIGLLQSELKSDATLITGRTLDEITSNLPPGAKGGNLSGDVWIVESVAITGGTLGAYAKWIRDVFDRQIVTYLVGVNRPDGNHGDPTQHLRNLLVTNDGASALLVVETVVLPNWGTAKCPWCREKSLLATSNALRNSAPEKFMNARRSHLDRSGIQGGIFLAEMVSKSDYESVFRLGRDSLFFDVKNCSNPAEVGEADVVSAVATTSELWRAANRPYRKETPVRGGRRQVSAGSIIGATTFTDPVSKAAIWRTFTADELFPITIKKLFPINEYFQRMLNKENNMETVQVLALEAILLLYRRGNQLDVDLRKLTDIERELWVAMARP